MSSTTDMWSTRLVKVGGLVDKCVPPKKLGFELIYLMWDVAVAIHAECATTTPRTKIWR